MMAAPPSSHDIPRCDEVDHARSRYHQAHWIWMVVALFLFLLFFPGIMSNDSISSLKQARALEFTNWHPPIMAMVWAVLDRVLPGPAGMLFAQSLLYSYSAARLCAVAFPQLSRRTGRWPIVLVFSLFPPAMCIVGMIWKDIWMSGLLLLALSHLFSLSSLPERRQRLRSAGVILGCCLLATAFRHNALAATAGLLAGAVYYLAGTRGDFRRLLVACIAGLLLSLALAGLVSAFNSLVSRPANITTALKLYDIAGIIVNSEDPAATARQALSTPTVLTGDPDRFIHNIQKSYSPASSSPLVSSRNKSAPFSVRIYSADHDAQGVSDVWAMMVKRHPGAYVLHRLKVLGCLLQLCDRRAWIQHTYFLNERYIFPAELEPGSLQWAARSLFLSPKLAILYMPAFWCLLTIAGGVVGFGRVNTSPLLFMGLSSLGLLASLALTSPVESFRYVHWILLVGWTMLFLPAEYWMATRQRAAAGDASGA